jgi:hypothetical protein
MDPVLGLTSAAMLARTLKVVPNDSDNKSAAARHRTRDAIKSDNMGILTTNRLCNSVTTATKKNRNAGMPWMPLRLGARSFVVYIRRSNHPNATLNVGVRVSMYGSSGATRRQSNIATGGTHSIRLSCMVARTHDIRIRNGNVPMVPIARQRQRQRVPGVQIQIPLRLWN